MTLHIDLHVDAIHIHIHTSPDTQSLIDQINAIKEAQVAETEKIKTATVSQPPKE